MFEVIILIISLIVNAVICVTVLAKNYKSVTNRAFAILIFALVCWTGSTYLSVNSTFAPLFLVRFVMFWVVVENTSFYFLTKVFPSKSFTLSLRPKIELLFSLIVMATTLSPFLFTHLATDSAGVSSPVVGPGMVLFLAHVAWFVVGGIVTVVRRFVKSTGLERAQARSLLIGAAILYALVPISNFIMPLVFNVSFQMILSPIYTTLFAFVIGYSIITQKLFDIRLVVARSVSYILLLVILAGFYAAAILAAQAFVFPNANYSTGYIALQIVLATIMAFSFQPLRAWITKATDKVFFKHSYDQDDLLGELSNTMGSTIVLIELLYKIGDILTRQMKVSTALFALARDDSKLYAVQAIGYKQTPDIDPKDVTKFTHDGIIQADNLEDGSRMKHLMSEYSASMAIPLRTDKEVVGVLLLGEKSSGDMYSQQDISVLEILAPELAVAVENAKSYEEISRFNITLRQEIKRATYRLKQKNVQLMELDHAKDEFISMASHQLRTPLTAIKGYLSMLLEGDAGDIKVSQYDFINEAYSGANRMVGLINDLLNVSRMDTGRFFLEPKDVDIERVVNEEVKQLSNAAKAKGLYLKLEVKGRVPHIMADETKIRQVVMNFMDNAIYYTNTGGVTVMLKHDKDNFIYEVHDTGIGVPKEQREHMFEKFFRADNARTARPDGTGLGIYLAKRVVLDHGGEIIFDSEEGKGSVFGFKFPLKKVAAKVAAAPVPRPAETVPATSAATKTVTEIKE